MNYSQRIEAIFTEERFGGIYVIDDVVQSNKHLFNTLKPRQLEALTELLEEAVRERTLAASVQELEEVSEQLGSIDGRFVKVWVDNRLAELKPQGEKDAN